jgi:hypothetical protein
MRIGMSMRLHHFHQVPQLHFTNLVLYFDCYRYDFLPSYVSAAQKHTISSFWLVE